MEILVSILVIALIMADISLIMAKNSIQLLSKNAVNGPRCLFALSTFVSSY